MNRRQILSKFDITLVNKKFAFFVITRPVQRDFKNAVRAGFNPIKNMFRFEKFSVKSHNIMKP